MINYDFFKYTFKKVERNLKAAFKTVGRKIEVLYFIQNLAPRGFEPLFKA